MAVEKSPGDSATSFTLHLRVLLLPLGDGGRLTWSTKSVYEPRR